MRDVHIVDRAKINIERNNRVTGFDRYSFKVFIFLCGTVNNEVVKAAGGSLGDFAVLKCKSDLVFAERKRSIYTLKTKGGVEIIVTNPSLSYTEFDSKVPLNAPMPTEQLGSPL